MKSYFALVTTLIAASAAVPFGLQPRGIDRSLLSTLKLVSQYAAASYCPENSDSPHTKVRCSAGSCPRVEAANVVTVHEFENSLVADTTGYVAVDKTNRNIVCAFRGSRSVRNWLINAQFVLGPTDLCSGCTAHSGFWDAWVESRDKVMPAIKDAVAANPGYKVVITGHSLGGAMAVMAAAQLRKEGTPAALYTFGAPRVGNMAFSSFITNQPGGNYRITHTDDPVPRLPPTVFGFVHISPEYYVTTLGGNDVSASDITVLQGAHNAAGNAGTFGFNVEAHGQYFGNIGACGSIELAK